MATPMPSDMARSTRAGNVLRMPSRNRDGLELGPASPWNDSEHRHPHPHEHDEEQAQHGRRDAPAMLFHRGIQNGQLAHKRAKGRRAGHREEPGQEQCAGPRDAPERPRHVLDVLAVVGAVDVPGREEHHALDDPVVQHVEKSSEDAAAAEAQAERQNPHVLDARIRQHALEVSLTDREHAGDGHREESEHDQDTPGKCPLSRRGQDVKDPGESEKGAARQGPGHEGAHDPRRLAIRVGLPRMHGGQSHLRSIPDHEQHEGRLQPGLRESRRVADEVIEQQRGLASRLDRGIPQEERAQEGQRDADRTDHQVLPRRLQGSSISIEVEQRAAGQSGRLEGDPHEAEMVGPHDEGHHSQEEHQTRAEDAVWPLGPLTQIADSIDGDHGKERAHEEQHEPPGRIEHQPPPGARLGVGHDSADRHGQMDRRHDGQPERPASLGAPREGDEGAGHGDENTEQREGHGSVLQGGEPFGVDRRELAADVVDDDAHHEDRHE